MLKNLGNILVKGVKKEKLELFTKNDSSKIPFTSEKLKELGLKLLLNKDVDKVVINLVKIYLLYYLSDVFIKFIISILY